MAARAMALESRGGTRTPRPSFRSSVAYRYGVEMTAFAEPTAYASVPDVICCLDGRFFAFEVKTPEGRLTKLQENTIHKIKVAGGHAYVVRSVADVKDILWANAGIKI